MHEGHRSRMRERYLANQNFSGFSDCEILEMLLYYGRPRGNTNPSAHELLAQFGSVKAIFEASVDELCRVKEVGMNSAILIKLVTEAMRRYSKDLTETARRYDTMSVVLSYLSSLFLGLDHEHLYMLMFNDRLNLLECIRLSEGSVNSSDFPIRKMIERIIQKKATAVILAHNHPNGLAVPSSGDLEITDTVNNMLMLMDVTLLEHFIVTEKGFWPIMRQHYGVFRNSPVSGRVESKFYEHFYDVPESEYSLNVSFPK